MKRCVVLGAGLAGLTAAFELVRAGCRVTLVEAAPFAGGRASSWKTRSGLLSGTGLHVVASHYVNLLDVLNTVGGTRDLVWWDRHTYLRPGSRPIQWQYNRLPAPFHLLRAAIGIPESLSTRLRLAGAGLDAVRRRQSDLEALDRVPYLKWHAAHGLGSGFIRELADMAADAATFLPLEQASARAVLSWLKYMCADCAAGRIGTWRVPLREGLVEPLVRAIREMGGEIRLESAAFNLEVDGERVRRVAIRRSSAARPCYSAAGQLDLDGPEEAIACDAVVSALPVQHLRTLMGQALLTRAGLANVMRIATVPALSVSIRFDRKIRPLPVGAALVAGCPIRDFIEIAAPDEASAFLFLVSRADEWMKREDGDIVRAVVHGFGEVWPPAAGAKPLDAAVERIGAAMFAATPGAHELRPPTETRIPNLFLAGDWVRHDLNASMEGAVVSGRMAARAVLGGSEVVPMLAPREPLYARVIAAVAGRRN